MGNSAIALDFRCVSGALWRSGAQLTLITFASASATALYSAQFASEPLLASVLSDLCSRAREFLKTRQQ